MTQPTPDLTWDGWLGYAELAKALAIPRGTLQRKLLAFNAKAQTGQRIHPRLIEQTPSYRKHLYHPDQVPALKVALASITRPVGRPKPPTPKGV